MGDTAESSKFFTYLERRQAPVQGKNVEFTIRKGFNMEHYFDHAYGEQEFPPEKEGGEPFLFRNLSVRLAQKEKQIVQEERRITQGKKSGQMEVIEVNKEVFVTHSITDGEAIDRFFKLIES